MHRHRLLRVQGRRAAWLTGLSVQDCNVGFTPIMSAQVDVAELMVLCLVAACQVVTHTSDLRGAGTDANVHLVMHGTLGDGVRHVLQSGHDDFNR